MIESSIINMEERRRKRPCDQGRFFLYATPLALLLYISIMDLKRQPLSEVRRQMTFPHNNHETTRKEYQYFTDSPPYDGLKLSNSTSRLENDDILFLSAAKARSFEQWYGEFPCFKPQWELPRDQGLLYLKPLKTGGSTGAGINARIAKNVAQRMINATFPTCDRHLKHAPARVMCPHRNRDKSFLWTTIREAKSRIVSQFFFFDVSRYKHEPTDRRFKKYVRENALDDGLMATCDHYMKVLSTDKNQTLLELDPIEYVNRIVDEYDFIGVTERMEESTVALAMLLRVPLGDALYLNAKQNGGYDEGGFEKRCTYIVPSYTSRGMEDFIQNPWFQKCIRLDNILHQTVNRSLDLTIEKLGRSRFERQLERFQRARALAEERCQPNYQMPCSAQGEKLNQTDCLWADSGCGYHCLNDLATDLDLWQVEY